MMGRIRLLAHAGLTMIGVMATCIMRGVQPLQYRGHPMWDFKGEDDATRHGRKGPDSAEDLVKILSGLYKGEKEDFLRTNQLNRFSMNNPWPWVSEHFTCPTHAFKFLLLCSSFDAGAASDGGGHAKSSPATRGSKEIPGSGL